MENKNEPTLDQFMDFIKKTSIHYYLKLKQPSIHDVDSLVNEGVIIFYVAKEKYSEDRKASFKTFFFTCLRNHLRGILDKSFRTSKIPTTQKKECLLRTSVNPEKCKMLSDSINHLGVKDLNYLHLLIDPPLHIKAQFQENQRRKKVVVRKYFSLSYEEDSQIRKRIKRAILA